MILVILAIQFGSVFGCIVTKQAASTRTLCAADNVTIYDNPHNECWVAPTISYTGTTATVACTAEVTSPTSEIVSYVSYNTNVITTDSEIELICIDTRWTYTSVVGTETAQLHAMRFYPLTLVLSGLIFAAVGAAPASSVIDASGEAPTTEPALLNQEEQQHRRLQFYNWDYKDLGTTAFEDIPLIGRQPPAFVNQTEKCEDGWFRFADSCYFIEKELLGFAKAEKKCFEKQSTLFVANTLEEWDTVRQNAPESYFSWLGLVRFTHYEKTEQLPRWQTEGGIHPSKLNWLIKPYKPIVNGWTQFANCAASYKSPAKLESASYTYFYPCTYFLYSICERNSTIVNAMQ